MGELMFITEMKEQILQCQLKDLMCQINAKWSFYGKNMTVKELIDELKKFPENTRVMDYEYNDIKDVYENIFAYNKPNEEVVVIIY